MRKGFPIMTAPPPNQSVELLLLHWEMSDARARPPCHQSKLNLANRIFLINSSKML